MVYNVGGQEIRIAPREVMRHTGCMPAEIGFQLKSGQRKPGSASAVAVTSRYEAKGGQVFRLTGGKGGDIAIDVSAK